MKHAHTTPGPIRSMFTAVNINMWRSGTSAKYVSNGEPAGFQKALEVVGLFIREQLDGFPGIVGLQEIGHNLAEDGVHKGTIDQAEWLANALGPDWTGVFGRTVEHKDGRAWGNGLSSSVTVEKRQVWSFYRNPDNSDDYGAHPRGATAVKLAFPGNRKLWVVATHLDRAAVALRQIFQLLGQVKTFDPDFPALVMGDFNIKRVGQGAHPEEFATLSAIMDEATSGFRRIVYQGRVHMYLYDPHDRLEVVDSGYVPGTHGGIQFTDHNVLKARFAWN